MIMHKQKIIKTNSECDEGIVPLVLALNEIDGVITLDSCQYGCFGLAYVFFRYGDSWQMLGNLLQAISSELSHINFDFSYTLHLEWLGSNEWPRAQLLVKPEHITTLAKHIRALIGVTNARMFVLADDM